MKLLKGMQMAPKIEAASEAVDVASRESYQWFIPLPTRWMDNDVYGHVNNVNYYSYFDTVVNMYLIGSCGLDILESSSVGYTVHSECFYKSGVGFPDELEGGLRVNRIGNSSVQYGLSIFKKGDKTASAHGTFTHVFVDRKTEKPVPIAGQLRSGLTDILVG